MQGVIHSILEAIGNTPLVRLNRLITGAATVAVKLEYLNPAHSVKDRIGAAMIDAAEARGEIRPDKDALDAVAAHFGIEFCHHDALEDAAACATVAQRLGIPENFLRRFDYSPDPV